MFVLYFPYKNKLIFSFFRMSGTYQDYALEATNPPFVSNEPLNGTKIEQSILEPNETNLEELENYDVASYLESLLGPQRQPVEKVCHIFWLSESMHINKYQNHLYSRKYNRKCTFIYSWSLWPLYMLRWQ